MKLSTNPKGCPHHITFLREENWGMNHCVMFITLKMRLVRVKEDPSSSFKEQQALEFPHLTQAEKKDHIWSLYLEETSCSRAFMLASSVNRQVEVPKRKVGDPGLTLENLRGQFDNSKTKATRNLKVL